MKTTATSAGANIVIREFDVLLRGPGDLTAGIARIGNACWDWLHGQCARGCGRPAFFAPIFRNGVVALQARNYVGSVETPAGTRIEIIPKLANADDTIQASRATVIKMLRRVLDLPMHAWNAGSLAVLEQPLHEILISLFLSDVERLVKKGLRSHYVLREEEQPFLRGRLRMHQQLHRRPGARPEFAIEYHEFVLDRPENRLIHSAVRTVNRWSRDPENQRRARTLRFLLGEIPESQNPAQDLQKWSLDRALVDYRGLKPWCELILTGRSPLVFSGEFSGLSFLFPMEQLFERYAAAILNLGLAPSFKLVRQASRHSLATHLAAPWFRLKPDLLIQGWDGSCRAVLDTKWKRIDESLGNTQDKYGLSQADFYQMAAYGQHYLGGTGDMFLVYPRSAGFNRPLPVFQLTKELNLWVVPFDLASDQLLLPHGYSGEWMGGGNCGGLLSAHP